ncbi:MAG: DNA glycosylase [Candidatus Nanohaloarchaea archaeon]|nr:DNA glycosylase [Candidatus Nanohaloarchaea archaeon]
MRSGTLDAGRDELNLSLTMEVGQTFAWHHVTGGNLYRDEGDGRYYVTQDGDVLILWQDGDTLHYEATGGMEHQVEDRLRLHESLSDIRTTLRGRDQVLDEALERYRGLRILQDDFFPCLISYLCSVQMRIPRIKELYDTLAREYGQVVEYDGREFLQFPTVQQLAEASEEELRDLGVGYRAKYIAETTDQLMRGEVTEEELAAMTYRDAHETIQDLYGVGDKVADCVLLFSLGKLEAFPLDTWAWRAIEQYYPEDARESEAAEAVEAE